MRKSKVVRLDENREITVKEITPKMMIDIFGRDQGPDDGANDSGFSKAMFDNLCREGCGMSVDELACLYGSELEQIWLAFQEINGFFFKTAARVGLAKIPELVTESLTRTFGEAFADSLKTGTRVH